MTTRLDVDHIDAPLSPPPSSRPPPPMTRALRLSRWLEEEDGEERENERADEVRW